MGLSLHMLLMQLATVLALQQPWLAASGQGCPSAMPFDTRLLGFWQCAAIVLSGAGISWFLAISCVKLVPCTLELPPATALTW